MEDYFAEEDSTEIGEIETLKAMLAEEKAKAESCLENWKRAQADFINYKRRQEQDREETGKSANSTLILGLLPVLDDLKRAMESIPPRLAKTPWVDGIRLIERKFLASLEAEGLSLINALGEPFDPNLHEANMHTEGEEGMVVKEFLAGYRLYDRVLRPAVVAVGSGHRNETADD
jgi:molecular chaperone GrpE